MLSSHAYLFLELAIIVYFIGFGWEYWRAARLRSRTTWIAVFALSCVWFVLDQVALHFGLWTFPDGGSLPVRIFALPIEEYILFFIHTLICLMLLKRYSRDDE